MGKIISEEHIYAGGVETSSRENEIIVIMDCHDEDGYGVYIDFPESDQCSFTTCFGYGYMAELMAQQFFAATVNYFEQAFKLYDATAKTWDIMQVHNEWKDTWMKLVLKTYKDEKNRIEIGETLDPEMTHIDGIHHLFAFVSKWAEKNHIEV